VEDVFISYKFERRSAAEHLAEVMRCHGYSVWFDYHLIKGDDYDFQLDAKLVSAKAVVVLWCAKSVESKWVSREATKASMRGTLLPVLIEECELKTAHVNSDCIDLRAWDGCPRSHALDPLFDALEAKVGRGPVPDVKTLRAYEETWRRFGAPSLKAFAIDLPCASAEAAVACPNVPDNGDVRRLKHFEERSTRTFCAEEATELRVAIEADGAAQQAQEWVARRKTYENPEAGLIRTFTGHAYWVRSAAFAPNGRLALSGGGVPDICPDFALHLWDVVTGQELRTFAGHAGGVSSIAFAPDGCTALSGSGDTTLKLWDVATGQELRTYTGHKAPLLCVAFAPDGHTALSGGDDATLRLWDVVSGHSLRTFNGHSSWVWSVAFTPDGRVAVSGSREKTLILWEVGTGV